MTGSRASRLVGSLRSFADPRQVGYLIFYVTNRCNFRCRFCFYGDEIEKGVKPDEMTIGQIERFSRSVGPLLQLSLTGGEPFLRKDLIEVASVMIANTNPRYVTIPTNASLTERMVQVLEPLLAAHPSVFFRVVFSIEGIGDAHDSLRSMPGSYRKIEESHDALIPLRRRFPNLVLDSNSVFTAQSEDSLLDTVRTISERFQFDNISVTFARGEIKDPTLKTRSRQKYAAIHEFLRSRAKHRETRLLYPLWRAASDVARRNLERVVFDDEFVAPCVAGRKLLVVSETGEVLPCEILGRSMGQLRDFDWDLKALLATNQVADLRRWIRESRCKCSFECALSAGAVWNPVNYVDVVRAAIGNVGKGEREDG
ncbi:MAG: radical SAM protein [Alphaproteobacteria bacterium]|nr:radical SAM protein [Alphaproteobacteria bacterium]